MPTTVAEAPLRLYADAALARPFPEGLLAAPAGAAGVIGAAVDEAGRTIADVLATVERPGPSA